MYNFFDTRLGGVNFGAAEIAALMTANPAPVQGTTGDFSGNVSIGGNLSLTGTFSYQTAAVLPNFTNAGAPTNGPTGTLFGIAPKGALLLDITNATLYQNTNTLLSPTWTQLTAIGGAGAYTGTFNGAIGGVTPAAAAVTTMSASGIVTLGSVDNALVAAGTTRTDALALTKQINVVATALSGTGVILPAPVVGNLIFIYNYGANPIKVYAPGSATIDTVAGSTGVTLTNALRCIFTCNAAGVYISAQLGVPSA